MFAILKVHKNDNFWRQFWTLYYFIVISDFVNKFFDWAIIGADKISPLSLKQSGIDLA